MAKHTNPSARRNPHLWRSSLIILALSALLLELMLRLMGFSYYWAVGRAADRELGWRPLPNIQAWQRLEGEARVSTNALGFRGAEPQAAEADAVRIAVLGDSFTESVQLPFELSWSQQLGALLNEHCELGRPVNVQNYAVSGYSTAQQLRVLQQIVPDYQPDLVLLMFFAGNDMLENHPALAHDQQRPFFDAASGRWQTRFREDLGFRLATAPLIEPVWRAMQRLRVSQALRYIGDFIRVALANDAAQDPLREPGVDPAIYAAPTGPLWRQAWANTEALLGKMQRSAAALGADFVVAMAPTGYQSLPDNEFRATFSKQLGVDDLFYPERRLSQFAAQQGMPLIALAPRMAELAASKRAILHGFPNSAPGIGHWNAAGQRLAAELLGPPICAGLQQRLVKPNSAFGE